MRNVFDHVGANVHRLVDKPEGKPNAGRVQVKENTDWRDVCYNTDMNIQWNFENLTNLCQQLGYPGALLSREIKCGKNQLHLIPVCFITSFTDTKIFCFLIKKGYKQ